MTVFRYPSDTSAFSQEADRRQRERDLFGEQYEWGWAIPLAYRILQQPDGVNPYPKLGSRIAFWNPIEHFMLYHLGWTDPAQGLLRWEHEGFVTSHSVLRMMKAIWQDAGLLDDYLVERFRIGSRPYQVDRWLRPDLELQTGDNHSALHKKIKERAEIMDPEDVGGTVDGAHINYEMHNSAPTNFARVNDTDTPFFVWDDAHSITNDRYLFTTSMVGWYRIMMDGPLADYEKTNIPITVINESVGTLGTFRRSRITGLAYVGDHDVHLWGNPTKGEELLYA